MANKPQQKLKWGFTTGTAAAAAAKGALSLLLTGEAPKSVRLTLLTGDPIEIDLAGCRQNGPDCAACSVIKDAGDDPDITHKAEIGATVTIERQQPPRTVRITGGTGVGQVTKPGLEVPPGEPAINPGPRRMIREAVEDVWRNTGSDAAVAVEVFVPEGERLARNTLNPRLGIVGGISILGTTGVVKPLSHEAYVATIRSALSVAGAAGLDEAVLTTGRRSERHAQQMLPELREEAFVQIGDYFKTSLELAASFDLQQVTLAVFFGKAVKMARGIPHTHASQSAQTLSRLSQWTARITGSMDLADEILAANTARQAFDILYRDHRQVVAHVGDRMIAAGRKFSANALRVRGVIFDYDGGVAFDSGEAR